MIILIRCFSRVRHILGFLGVLPAINELDDQGQSSMERDPVTRLMELN